MATRYNSAVKETYMQVEEVEKWKSGKVQPASAANQLRHVATSLTRLEPARCNDPQLVA
jgi:hypothetical protein